MGMKFLNKKGWHTGSLRNIENVWKAEQKHEQEQKKLEELRKQILEERERAEFRQLQEQAGLVPRQERLDFLYDSGLAVGKSSEGFKSLEAYPKPTEESSAAGASSSAAEQSSTPGALFEVKPQSANDSWRKLHSDPLLMIRQREQEALARIRNNPVKMAMIRRSVEEGKTKEKSGDKKKKKKHGEKRSSHKKHSSRSRHSGDEDDIKEETGRGRHSKNEIARNDNHASEKPGSDSEDGVRVKGVQGKNDWGSRGGDIYDKDSRHYRDIRGRSDSEEEAREREGHKKKDMESRDSEGHIESREKDTYDKGSRRNRNVKHESDSEEEVRERGRGSQRKNDREDTKKEIYGNGSRYNKDVRRRSDSEEEHRERGSQRNVDREHRGNDDISRNSKQYRDVRHDSEDSRERSRYQDSKSRYARSDDHIRYSDVHRRTEQKSEKSMHNDDSSHSQSHDVRQQKKPISSAIRTVNDISDLGPDPNPQNRRKKAPKLTEEERAARLREMQLDAEVHEEQRWKRLKKADEDDAREAALAAVAKGKNFLEVAKKNVYGAEQGGSATIEESVRRRSHYLQGRSAADAGNAFRR